MDTILYFSLQDHSNLLTVFAVFTTFLSFMGFALMLRFCHFFKQSKEFELSILISRYYLYASLIYLVTGFFGIGGLFNYTTSIDDAAYIARPFVLAAVLFAGWRLFHYFKNVIK